VINLTSRAGGPYGFASVEPGILNLDSNYPSSYVSCVSTSLAEKEKRSLSSFGIANSSDYINAQLLDI
jgi:hypothetical protein